jgi:hypothetical protein
MTTQEHLERIKAKCIELLAIAEKRTQGRWHTYNGNAVVNDSEKVVVCHTTRTDCLSNTAFIASCAGPAEAGWAATIAAVDLIQRETASDMPYNSWDRLADSIIDAWPEELL